MKKITKLLPLIFLVSGCMSTAEIKTQRVDNAKTLQQKRDILLKNFTTNSSSPDYQRERFLKLGVETDDFLSSLILTCKSSNDEQCVESFYQNAYDVIYQENRNKCFQDSDCKRTTLKSDNINELNHQYYQFVYYNKYQTGQADALARLVCNAIAHNQLSGMPYNQAEDVVRSISGVEPVSREILVKIGNACWYISYYGESNPTSTIQPPR
ncbi:TPA: hypothetical protein OL568_003236 [Citrobacter freundii]|nr:hypothetical protein [Citrobacter freundii]MEB1034172.1 hypothetical protein [Citrobacter freundii]HCQ6560390.1 hypothetical protein [Citrobacter freundii]HCT6244034.1 hypothetical protein [Citrobacter freundii]